MVFIAAILTRSGFARDSYWGRLEFAKPDAEVAATVNQVTALIHGIWEDLWMGLWITIGVLLLFAVLVRADSRNRSNLPTRSWNIWFGPKPREGEGRARYTLRRALAAAVTLVVVSIPLFLASAPPDEGTGFSGHESTAGFAIFLVCAPLAAMAFFTLFALLFSALMSAIFRDDHVFDVDTGDFMRR